MRSVTGVSLAAACITLLAALAASPAAHAQIDPAGNWTPRFDEDANERIPGGEIGDYLGYPLNDAGRARSDAWDAALMELPENQCRSHGSDYGWRAPSLVRIWTDIDRETQHVIAYHTHMSAYGAEQTIWMDGRPHPPEYARHTWAGFATGAWDGDSLVITTTHLKENWLGLTGLPRSDQATARVHLMRHGNYLTVAVIIYDPVYFSEPFIRTVDFIYNAQQQMAPWPCESVDEVDRPPGVVPHHLPGTNAFLNEFPAKYGIPPQATRDGALTMYPEYVLRLKTLPKLPRPVKPAPAAPR
ncbi:MAG TPA: hypothetical protein VLW26_00165 [Steroidobacteraceae bacterium]|nr:hypothetical protein [Steroidobacteraceae bacterium]